MSIIKNIFNAIKKELHTKTLSELIEEDTLSVEDNIVLCKILYTRYSSSFVYPAIISENFTTALLLNGEKIITHNEQVYKVCNGNNNRFVKVIYRTRKSKSSEIVTHGVIKALCLI